MDEFDVKITKDQDSDTTIREVLKSVKFQNDNGNLLTGSRITKTQVTLTYQEP